MSHTRPPNYEECVNQQPMARHMPNHGPTAPIRPGTANHGVNTALYLPKEILPNDYLIVSIVMIIVCGFLNITSLCCTVPAVISASKAFESKHTGDLETAKACGDRAACLIVTGMLWVMFCALVAIATLTGILCTPD